MRKTEKDLTGIKFGSLTPIRRASEINSRTTWLCKCDCGNTTYADVYSLMNGTKKSCGCIPRAKNIRIKHNRSHHPLYACYYRMRHRCENPADKSYERYGGRGIKVCDEWKNDITAFINWGLANGYKEGLSIDRIDNDGDYSPENCRWANPTQQSNNRSTNAYVTYNGETHTYAEWSRITGIKQLTIRHRIEDLHWSVEDALTVPTTERRYGILQNANKKTIVYKDGKAVGVFNSQREAAKFARISFSSVSRCVKGLQDKSKGYVFRQYGKEEENG